MKSVNSVVLVGRLGKDPEQVEISGDKTLVRLSVATDRFGKSEATDWHSVKVWGQSADFALRYAKKGALVSVEGRIEYSTSEKDGVKRYYTDVVANRLTLLAGGQEAEQEKHAESDLPF